MLLSKFINHNSFAKRCSHLYVVCRDQHHFNIIDLLYNYFNQILFYALFSFSFNCFIDFVCVIFILFFLNVYIVFIQFQHLFILILQLELNENQKCYLRLLAQNKISIYIFIDFILFHLIQVIEICFQIQLAYTVKLIVSILDCVF